MSGDVALPVVRAVLFEDRAEVEREARVELSAGVQRLVLGPVTALASDRSLSAELLDAELLGGAGTVTDLRVVRRWAPRPLTPGQDASALARRVHELALRHAEAVHDRERAESRLAVLEQLRADVLRDITESAGAGEADPDRWSRSLLRADSAHTAQAEALDAARHSERELAARLREAEAAAEQAEERPLELTARLEAVVDAVAAGPAVLRVRHLTACALWRPAYRATLDGSRLRLEREAFVWQRTGEDWTDIPLEFSTARPALASAPPELLDDVLVLRDRSAEERRTTEVDLREVAVQDLGPAAGATEVVPGVDDGGEPRRLAAPVPVSVPSDGRPHRVLLGEERLEAAVSHVCVPELSPLVTLDARFRTAASSPPLLSGPVDLVRASGFVGRGELRFTAPGATAELGFGSEDAFRVTRSVVETRDSAALTGRTTLTRTVTVSLSHFAPAGAERVPVTVRERIPVSELSSVDVRVLKDRTSPPPDTRSEDGLLTWTVPLDAGQRQDLVLTYEISAPRSVALAP